MPNRRGMPSQYLPVTPRCQVTPELKLISKIKISHCLDILITSYYLNPRNTLPYLIIALRRSDFSVIFVTDAKNISLVRVNKSLALFAVR